MKTMHHNRGQRQTHDKPQKIKNGYIVEKQSNCIAAYDRVRFELSHQEIDEVKQAHELLKRYEKRAMELANCKRDSDWTSIDFVVGKENLFVEIRRGMCG